MRIDNAYGLPSAYVRAVQASIYPPTPGRIAVTTLIDAPLIRVLRGRHWDALHEDVVDRVAALHGTAMHALLAKYAPENTLSEERLTIVREGWTISGVPDLYEEPGIVSDYKTCQSWAVARGIKPEWTAQLNVYAHMLREHGFTVSALRIQADILDWTRGRARQDAQRYPQRRVITFDIPLWPAHEAESYILDRLRLHRAAEREPMTCTPEERWQEETVFAVMKAGRKSAVRVLDSREEADAMAVEKGHGHSVVERTGGDRRCKDFCAVAEFCPHGRAILDALKASADMED